MPHDYEEGSQHVHLHIHIRDPITINLHSDEERHRAERRHAELVALINETRSQIMASVAELASSLDDLKTKIQEYIDARNAINDALKAEIVQLKADLATALANDATDAAAIQAFQDGVDAAIAKSDEAKALLVSPVTPTP